MQKKELEKKYQKASLIAAGYRKQIDKIKEDDDKKLIESKIGKCFKYHNCYSCPKTEKDYWWTYFKIIGVGEYEDEVECDEFEIDKNGQIEIKRVRMGGIWMFRDSSYEPISVEEFNKATDKILAKMLLRVV